MPTVLRVGPYRFFFWADERQEPPHIHVTSAENEAKYWLHPVQLSWNREFRSGDLKEIERVIEKNLNLLLEHGMSSSMLDEDQTPVGVQVDDSMIRVRFSGGLELCTPVSRFPRLQQASPSQRQKWELTGRGYGIHWPDVDEDLSVRGLFATPRKMPEPAVEQIPILIGDLLKTTRRLNSLFPSRPFTPDGHLVGSIGEVVADYIYGLKLEPCSTPRFDAYTEDRRSVQIKLTGERGSSYGLRWSSKDEGPQPDLLICLKLTSSGFVEIYNGRFPVELLRGKQDQSNGQIPVPVTRLQKLNPSILPKVKSFESINRWFVPPFSDVA